MITDTKLVEIKAAVEKVMGQPVIVRQLKSTPNVLEIRVPNGTV